MTAAAGIIRIGDHVASLADALTPDAGSFTVRSGGDAFPAAAFEVEIGDEVILVGTRVGNVFSALTRDFARGKMEHDHDAEVRQVMSGETLAAAAIVGAPLAADTTKLLVASELVNVALGGSGPDTFDMAPDRASVPCGPVTFIGHNIGASVHELLLIKTAQLAADVIASVGVGGTLDETGLDIRADSDNIAAGHYVRFDLHLEVGHYVLVCNEAGHVHSGMAADFDVVMLTGATPAAVARVVP